jgi:hypothetical protein
MRVLGVVRWLAAIVRAKGGGQRKEGEYRREKLSTERKEDQLS